DKVSIIDPDILRQLLTYNKFDYKLEPKVREKYLSDIRKELKKGYIVISDDLNYYTSMRHKLKKIAEDFESHFFIIYISTPIEICLEWNKERGKPIPNKIIKKIYSKFDNFDKYNWDFPEATYDMSQIQDLKKEIEVLVDRLKIKVSKSERVSEKEEKGKKLINLNNEKLDKLTRDYVGILLQNSKFLPVKKTIIKARKLFINLYKNQFLKEYEIRTAFKDYLQKRFDIIISDELF
ncbi:MAG: hypothetical protein ACFFA0_14745, partial [Promethearchaeota archaeon]